MLEKEIIFFYVYKQRNPIDKLIYSGLKEDIEEWAKFNNIVLEYRRGFIPKEIKN
jgi:hypothetical protein